MKKILIAFLCVLSACSTTQVAIPETIYVCPKFFEWTTPQIIQLGDEDAGLSSTSMSHRAIAEDYDIRAQIRSNPRCGGDNEQ